MKRKRIKRPGWVAILSLALISVLPLAPAQGQNRARTRFGRSYGMDSPEAAQEQQLMQQALVPGFEEDVFTFARLRFDTDTRYGLGGGRQWDDDTPEADLNLTYRLFQVTSLTVRPGLNFIDITTKDLEKYPFVYLASAGRVVLSDSEVRDLRRYLLNGGFLMADDFWGDEQWTHFYEQLKRVFPEREPVELSLDHPIFHCVFNFKKEPQMPSVGAFFRFRTSYDPGWPYYDKNHDPHFYAIYDNKNRMMVIICHNNHFGDGWEHESDDESYFKIFSEPMAYPMFINILEYAMTH
ncbi:MAG TPA: DUF4159 domain-containing protein [Verrucomicrobiae bacterium]|nr:DUF4159 domain-containing protein [Verrucomicrobiae bacterium]